MTGVRRMWERVQNVPGLGSDLVALAVLVGVGAACSAYIFSQYDWDLPWEDSVVVAAEFEKVPGVRAESRQEVRIAGVTVGKIESAEPLPNGHARVEMALEPGHTVYSNARAVLRSKAPLNVMYVALDPGGPPGEPLPPGGTIPVSQTERAIQPFEVLDHLDERTQSALTSLVNEADAALANAPQQLPGGLRAAGGTLKSFRPVMTQLETRQVTIRQLVTSLAQISTSIGRDDERLARLTSSLQGTLSVVADRDKQLGATLQQLPAFTRGLDRAMTSARGLTQELNPTLESLRHASDELPSTLSRLRGTVRSAGRVVDHAGPVIRRAEPVVADLRPFAGAADAALRDLATVTGHLPGATASMVPWMNDLAAFVYQTSSAFSLADRNGGFGRANITLDVTNPSGGNLGPQISSRSGEDR